MLWSGTAEMQLHFYELEIALVSLHWRSYSPSVCRPLLELCLPSSLDPTLAPPGCHVLSIFSQYTPYHLAEGEWTEERREEYANAGEKTASDTTTERSLALRLTVCAEVPSLSSVSLCNHSIRVSGDCGIIWRQCNHLLGLACGSWRVLSE